MKLIPPHWDRAKTFGPLIRQSVFPLTWRALGLLAAGLFILSGCGAKMAVLDRTLTGGIYWPGGSAEEAVIQYDWSIQKLDDGSGGGAFLNFLTGDEKGFPLDPRKSKVLVRPFGVYVDSGNKMYVTDPGAKRVSVIDLNNLETFSFFKLKGGEALQMPLGVVSDSRGRIYVSDASYGKVYIFDEEGRHVSELPGEFKRPTGLALDEERDRLYVSATASHEVHVYKMDMTSAGIIGQRGTENGMFNYPTHLFVDADGNLYVTDAMNFRIQIFDAEARFVSTFGQLGDLYGNLDKPKGVAVDNAGHIYVVDSIKDMVKIYDRNGKLLLFFGEKGHHLGNFWLPTGIFIDRDNGIYVSDTYNMRVSAFRFLGEGREAD